MQEHTDTVETVEIARNNQTTGDIVATTEISPAIVRDYAYYKRIFQGRRMPFAYLDLDLLAQNIHQIVARAGTKNIRLASKSLRSVAVIQQILAADSCFKGIMCFTPQEAIYLAQQGLKDLLLGYPCWHAEDIAAVARTIADGTAITLMVDSVAHIEQIESIAQVHGVSIPVCLDIDMAIDLPGLHFGVWRSPLRRPADARPVIERIRTAEHVHLDGLMGYEAQIAGQGDNYPGQMLRNSIIQILKKRSINEIAERRACMIELVKSYGLETRFVNGGGTGSIATTRTEAGVTEITVGSGFYAPGLFDNYRDFHYQPAAGYAIEIVRRASQNTYTCLGGGYSASGAAGSDRLPKPYLPSGARLNPLEGAGEVQTPIIYTGTEHLALGDPILLRHSKAGELCERFTHLILVRDGAVVDEVTTYRGDGQCFI